MDEHAEHWRPGQRATAGLFISLEGGDGVGKTTQLSLLREHLTAGGRTVLLTEEPAGTPLGRVLSELLRGAAPEPPVARAEALLFLAARAQHVDTVVRPALERGETVLCSRFSHSTLAYQCHGLGLDPAAVSAADAFARDGLLPDVVLVLDADPAAARARRAGRAPDDRIEAREDEFHARVRRGFAALAAADPGRVRLVDALASPDAVQAALRAELAPWL